MSEAVCQNCRYFRSGDEEWGQCRRFPPQVYFGGRHDPTYDTAWPTVGPRAWCGEFKSITNEFAVVEGHVA
jgi:hypothetical protein